MMNSTCTNLIFFNVSLVDGALANHGDHFRSQVTYVKVTGLIAILSLLINTVFITITTVSLVKSKVGWKRFSFLLNLSVADILYAVSTISFAVFFGTLDTTNLKDASVSIISRCLNLFSIVLASFSLSAACGIQRIAISSPFSYQQMRKWPVISWMAAGWILSLMIGLARSLIYFKFCGKTCIYSVISAGVTALLFLLVRCGVRYAYVIVVIRKRYRKHDHLRRSQNTEKMISQLRCNRRRHFRAVVRLARSLGFTIVAGAILIASELQYFRISNYLTKVMTVQTKLAQHASCNISAYQVYMVILEPHTHTTKLLINVFTFLWLCRAIFEPLFLMITEWKLLFWWVPENFPGTPKKQSVQIDDQLPAV